MLHECIIDIRSIKSETGITEEDIAKMIVMVFMHRQCHGLLQEL